MRLLGLVTIALFAFGCTGAPEVQVGAGRIPTLTISGRLSLPSAAARAGVQSGSWRTQAGEQLAIDASDGSMTRVSVSTEVSFPVGEEAKALDLGAIERIDLQMLQSAMTDVRSGLPANDPPVEGQPVIEGVAFDGARLALSFGLRFACPPDQIEALPTMVDVNIVLQPIVTLRR